MCYDTDATPPVHGANTAAVDTLSLTLDSTDGTQFAAFAARPDNPGGAGVVILPDQRGLCPFYEQLTTALAAHGHAAIAIDYYGRTAGTDHRNRGTHFPDLALVMALRRENMQADMTTAADYLRTPAGGACEATVAMGFCMGGRAAFFASAPQFRFTGAIGFYGHPGIAGPYGPGPTQHATELSAPILGLFGGADHGIPPEAITEFTDALTTAGVEHEMITYPEAPHGFFDTQQDQFTTESTDAWQRVLHFLDTHTNG